MEILEYFNNKKTMSDQKITDLSTLATPDLADLLEVVDVSPTPTNKKLTLQDLLGLSSTANLTQGHFFIGDVTNIPVDAGTGLSYDPSGEGIFNLTGLVDGDLHLLVDADADTYFLGNGAGAGRGFTLLTNNTYKVGNFSTNYLNIDDDNSAIDLIGKSWTFSPVSFSGVGSDDLSTVFGTYTGIALITYTITISSTGTPDKIDWSDDQGNSGTAEDIQAVNALSFGVVIAFDDTIGHTIGDEWTFSVEAAANSFLNYDGSTKTTIIGDVYSYFSGAKIKINGQTGIINFNDQYNFPFNNGLAGEGLVSNGSGSLVFQPVVVGASSSTDNAIARFDGTTGKIIQNSSILITDTNNITGVKTIYGEHFQFTVNDPISSGSGFIYADNIQNGFDQVGAVTGTDASNIFSGLYWNTANGSYTKSTFGLTGNHVFLWNKSHSAIDGCQAVAGSLFNQRSDGTITEGSSFHAFISTAGAITTGSFFTGSVVSFFSGGLITNLRGFYLPSGSISSANATNKHCLYFEDTSPSYFAGNVGIGNSNPSIKFDVQDNVNGALQASISNNSTGTSAYTQFFIGASYFLHLGDNYSDPSIAGTGVLHGNTMLTIESNGDTVFANGGDYSDIKFRMDTNGNLRAYYLHNNATAHGDSTEQDIRSGDYNSYTPTPSNSTNTDSAVTVAGGIFCRIGNWVDVKMEFTADPTLTATTTSFEVSLPITSNLVQTYDLVGHAVCGSIAGMSAQVMGEVTNNTAKISWVSTDITSQTWSLSFGYIVK